MSKPRTKEQERRRRRAPYGILAALRRNAKRRSIQCDIKIDQFKSLLACNPNCFYCCREVTAGAEKSEDRLTIDRIDNKGNYNINNIVVCCHRCNRVKSNIFTVDQMLEIAERYF